MKNIMSIFPARFRESINNICFHNITDIRISPGKPVFFMGFLKEWASLETITYDDIGIIVGNATENSLYSFMDNIREGFITLRGGHRMGIAGMAVYENGRLLSVKDINYINIRIAREIKGVANGIINKITTMGEVENTLIISSPGGGKTTLLRDISRILGNIENMCVSIIDSRYEIGAQYKGVAQTDIGARSFLLSGYSKKDGFSHAIRSLSSKVILSDELSEDDYPYIKAALNSGASVISTAHGKSMADVKNRFDISLFSRFVIINNMQATVLDKEGEVI